MSLAILYPEYSRLGNILTTVNSALFTKLTLLYIFLVRTIGIPDINIKMPEIL